MADNVTAFPGAGDLPENPMQLAQRHPGWCSHNSVLVDEHTRTIQCADPKCGATLDAFDLLRNHAQLIQRGFDAHRHAMKLANEVTERVHAIKKEEQRLRAMVKRLQDKTGAVLTVSQRL